MGRIFKGEGSIILCFLERKSGKTFYGKWNVTKKAESTIEKKEKSEKYIVSSGETLADIARTLSLEPGYPSSMITKISKLNNINPSDPLKIGQELEIPTKKYTVPNKSLPDIIEDLYGLDYEYEKARDSIKQLNYKLGYISAENARIKPGDEIVIPVLD